ncbi:pyroglutamyl-peptidase I [Planomicrobium sp. Y74]|uniref:pyroglutamyl-peptidase I n=1 Tax=Planomicrobium sp. Y74 TaxID=2478977 RepID=UPI000EF47FEA|nr:pyroglutamyl-peptidase I [Planomicrobium sp. Y74]RLQ86592.1 pyroglutamyl-peptidase I [Planomicrobium sp. Y74]
MKKLLLTGFEPFLDFSVNPTMKVVEELDNAVVGEYQVIGRILPVDFAKAGGQIIDLIEEIEPDAIVSLGLAAGRFKMTPERIALNLKDGPVDNEGNQPTDELVRKDGPAGYLSTLPIRNMVIRMIEEGLPADISNTAGAYLCNNVMYEALHYMEIHKKDVPSGFIHMPASHELAIEHGNVPSWPHRDLVKGVRICLEVLAAEEASESSSENAVTQ